MPPVEERDGQPQGQPHLLHVLVVLGEAAVVLDRVVGVAHRRHRQVADVDGHVDEVAAHQHQQEQAHRAEERGGVRPVDG